MMAAVSSARLLVIVSPWSFPAIFRRYPWPFIRTAPQPPCGLLWPLLLQAPSVKMEMVGRVSSVGVVG